MFIRVWIVKSQIDLSWRSDSTIKTRLKWSLLRVTSVSVFVTFLTSCVFRPWFLRWVAKAQITDLLSTTRTFSLVSEAAKETLTRIERPLLVVDVELDTRAGSHGYQSATCPEIAPSIFFNSSRQSDS